MIAPDPDRNFDAELLRALVDVPARARRLYPRGGFEGLEPNALQVLVALRLEPGQTVGELVARLALGQGTVSTALALLRRRGLSEEHADPADKRRRRQGITASGRRLVARFLADTAPRLEPGDL